MAAVAAPLIPVGIDLIVVGAGAAAAWWAGKSAAEGIRLLQELHDSNPSVAAPAQKTLSTAIVNTLADPAYQAQAKLSAEEARLIALNVYFETHNSVRNLVFPIMFRIFASLDEAHAWHTCVAWAYNGGYLSYDEYQIATITAMTEISRLTAPPVTIPVPPPVEVPVPAAPVAAPTVAPPKWQVGDWIQRRDGIVYQITRVYPDLPIRYDVYDPRDGTTGTVQESYMDLAGAVRIPAPVGLPAAVPPAVPAAPAAPAVPQVIVPGLETVGPAIGGLTGALPGILSMAGVSTIAGLLSGAMTLGEGMHTGSLRSQLSAGQKMMEMITKVAGPVTSIALLEAPGIKDYITDPVTDWVFDSAIKYVTDQGQVRPEDAPRIARRVFEAAIAAGLAAHAASVAAEISTPLKTMGLGYLAAFAADMAGFSRIAAATVGVVEARGIATPMGYYVNSRVRSQLPGAGELARLSGGYQLVSEADRRHLAQTDQGLDEIDRLNRQQYYYWMQYHGYADMWLPTLYDGTHRGAGDRLLRFMANQGIWDPAYYRTELLRSGYELDTARHSLAMLYGLAHGELKTLFTGAAITRYKEGLDNDEALVSNLTMLGVGEQLLPKYVFAAHLEADLDDYTDDLATLRAAVAKKLISPDNMEAQLLRRLGRPEKARILADRERVRMTGTTKVIARDTAVGLAVDIEAVMTWTPPRPRPISLGLAVDVAPAATWSRPMPRETDIGLTVSVPSYKTMPAPELRPTSIGLQITIEE